MTKKQKFERAKLLEWLFRKHPSIPIYAFLYSANSPELDYIINHMNPTEFARMICVNKQAVSKQIKECQKHFNFQLRPEQRSASSCKKMSDKRISQLKTK